MNARVEQGEARAEEPRLERRFVDVAGLPVHLACCGSGTAILLLHQTPRSWDEYRTVLPLLGEHFRAIAMDTPGFGDSAGPALAEDSIENWARAAIGVLDALAIDRAFVVGHHTGAATAIELAAACPGRIVGAVLSAPPFVDRAYRAAHAGLPVVDRAERRSDGSHLLDLWRMRQPWYPEGDIDLLERYLVDAVRAGARAAHGHVVVASYRMEERLPLVHCPTLVLAPVDDPHAYPRAPRVARAIAGARLVEIPGGRVPLPDQMPETFARTVREFVESVASGGIGARA